MDFKHTYKILKDVVDVIRSLTNRDRSEDVVSKLIKRLHLDSRVPGASAVDLKKAERALGVLFPDEYKDLFLQTNGAQFGEWSLHPVPTRQEVLQDIVRHNEKRPASLPR